MIIEIFLYFWLSEFEERVKYMRKFRILMLENEKRRGALCE